ncbi:MAG: hypothetical protein NTU97_02975, partial [Candidatus Magasanikbacteria bacterium]|nr:hypothetical protein [Candidatus Magasanikbacteria bacterium]
ESLNPLIREGAVNKHLPKDYQDKIALLRKYRMRVAGHLQIKPPFVTERETVEDVIASARELYGKGLVDRIIIMTMNSRPSTLVGKLEQEGKYELPSHWSVVEIMRQLGKGLCHETRFYGFVVMDPKIKVVKGCEECDDVIMPLILDFSGSGDEYDRIMAAADSLNCPCKREWQQKMDPANQPSTTLPERIAKGLDDLGREYLGKSFQEMKEE